MRRRVNNSRLLDWHTRSCCSRHSARRRLEIAAHSAFDKCDAGAQPVIVLVFAKAGLDYLHQLIAVACGERTLTSGLTNTDLNAKAVRRCLLHHENVNAVEARRLRAFANEVREEFFAVARVVVRSAVRHSRPNDYARN